MWTVRLVFFIIAAVKLEAVEINCEKIDRYKRFEKCCYLYEVISETNATFSGLENSEVQAFRLYSFIISKSGFLPVKIYKKFPNLKVYIASSASIKKISFLNFEKLKDLNLLDLNKNQIESIPDDCFQGLIKLQKIDLSTRSVAILLDTPFKNLSHAGYNKIKTMNGVAFTNLPRLLMINLKYNTCIGKLFNIERGSNNFRRKISRYCASDNAPKNELACSESIACNDVHDYSFVEEFTKAKICCELEFDSYIDAHDYTFADDTNYKNTEILIIAQQQNVEFLPVSVHESFPILRIYFVVNVPVPKISKRNFEKMLELKYLKLERNGIEVIRSDTFEDLTSLERLQISTREGLVFIELYSLIS